MINSIQFQKGLSLPDFMAQYGTEQQSEAALIQARWPHGYRCPHCQHAHAFEFQHSGHRYWQCRACWPSPTKASATAATCS